MFRQSQTAKLCILKEEKEAVAKYKISTFFLQFLSRFSTLEVSNLLQYLTKLSENRPAVRWQIFSAQLCNIVFLLHGFLVCACVFYLTCTRILCVLLSLLRVNGASQINMQRKISKFYPKVFLF